MMRLLFSLTTAAFLLTRAALAAPGDKPLTPPDVLGKANTVHFLVVDYQNGVEKEVSEAWLEKPNKAYAEDTDRQRGGRTTIYASDGKTQTEYRKSRGHYTQSPAPARLEDIDAHPLSLSALSDFYAAGSFQKFKLGPSDEKVTDYALSLSEPGSRPLYEVLRVDALTGLPQSIIITSHLPATTGKEKDASDEERMDFEFWELDEPIDDSKFAYASPADAKLYVPPKLLANGANAPDFTARDKVGKSVHLSDYRGKTVVLDFWATWCGPCQMSLPHTARVAKKDANKGVVVLALNVWDTPAAFHAWLPRHPEYRILHFAIDPVENRDKGIASGLYGVSGIPTQYVIDKKGKIVRSIVGYEAGSKELEAALKAAGVP